MADSFTTRVPRLIVVPLVLGIVAALALLVFAELGYQRLESAAQRVASSLELQSSLYEAQSLVVDAEAGQRGFLLTGRDEYLVPYREALPKIEPDVHAAARAHADDRHAGAPRLGGAPQHAHREEARRDGGHARAQRAQRPRRRFRADEHRHRPAHDGRDPLPRSR